MGELENCARCGTVFVRGIRNICPNCFKKEEEAFQTVRNFLRDQRNKKATMLEIVEETGIEEWYITKFIKEKRLLISQFPNLAYPCESCGTGITIGRFCQDCKDEIKKDLKTHEQIKNRMEEMHKKESLSTNTYYTLNKHKRN